MIDLGVRQPTFQSSIAKLASQERYERGWSAILPDVFGAFLEERTTILDVGSGRTPTIARSRRPEQCTYLGLDVSEEELELAPPGSYDEVICHDLCDYLPGLDSSIDLAISVQVLEHVESLGVAVSNVYKYLKPGGKFVSVLSGRNAHFAILNRWIPERAGKWAMQRLLNRPPESVFRAHYDACTYAGIESLLSHWTSAEIIPIYRGAQYFRFFRPLRSLYLVYENWTLAGDRRNLATHYVIVGTK